MSDRAAWALRAAKEAGDGILARVRPRPPLSSAFGGLLRLTLCWGRARRASALCHPRRSS